MKLFLAIVVSILGGGLLTSMLGVFIPPLRRYMDEETRGEILILSTLLVFAVIVFVFWGRWA